MDIGTGKVTQKEMRGVPHHLLDVADPARPMWNASKYKAAALRALAQIQSRGNLPILVGGSGYWVDAVALGKEFPDAPMDKRFHTAMAKKSLPELVAQVQKLDPARAAQLDLKNPVRVIRAIEIALYEKSHSASAKKPATKFDALYLVLDLPDEALKEKIAARLKKRLAAGLIAEVKHLRSHGVSAKKMFTFGLEYRFASDFLDGKLTAPEMETRLASAIWHYARRQRTWLRRNKGAVWLDARSKKTLLHGAEKLSRNFLQAREGELGGSRRVRRDCPVLGGQNNRLAN
jgi:tRNA dimethylallyltransferase